MHRLMYNFHKGMILMYNNHYTYQNQHPYFHSVPMCNCRCFHANWVNQTGEQQMNQINYLRSEERVPLKDYGKQPFTIDIEDAAEDNRNFRTALWTGEHLQVTLMSLGIGEDIGLETHPNTDQFIRIEEGRGLVQMGDTRDNLTFERRVKEDDAIMIPAGKWHNLTNAGREPLKLYSIYAPPEHPFGTVHRIKADED